MSLLGGTPIHRGTEHPIPRRHANPPQVIPFLDDTAKRVNACHFLATQHFNPEHFSS
jgi:hypothetical protein